MHGPNKMYRFMGAVHEITILRNVNSIHPSLDGWWVSTAGSFPEWDAAEREYTAREHRHHYAPIDPGLVHLILVGARKEGKKVTIY